jgi:hypothetical protein
MPRKNPNADVELRRKAKPKPKKPKTDRPGGKRLTTPADDDAAVSLTRLRANPRRGGRGR